MPEEVSQKIGRGGAGNIYAKRDLELALAQNEGREVQKPSGSAHNAETQGCHLGYLHSGRGGAGNVVSPTDQFPSSTSPVISVIGHSEDALDSKLARSKGDSVKVKTDPYAGRSGRGGAGNWRQASSEEERRQEEEETKVRTAVHEKVRVHVELGLKPPPKAYTASENAITGP